MVPTNAKLAALFLQTADVLEILGANRFRVIAFQRAARVLDDLATDVADFDPEQLTSIDGIGKGMAERIRQFTDTGQIAEHQELLGEVPKGLLGLLDIPGLGPKSVSLLWKEAAVTDLSTLTAKLDSGELEQLPGFGKKKVENIKKNLAFAADASRRVRLGDAMPLALWFVDQLHQFKLVKQAAYAGSLRRGRETIRDLDLLVAAAPADGAMVSNSFVKLEPVTEVIAKGPTKTSIRTDQGIQVDLRIVGPESFGAALMYFTGSKSHNVAMRERAMTAGMKLNEYGLDQQDTGQRVAGQTEQQVFAALGLAWIPPELREDHGEFGLAETHRVPDLIELEDIQAELHAHTNASDGHWPIHELAAAAAERGFHTVAVTDHSRGQVQANGLTAERLEKHITAIRKVATEMKGKIIVLAGSEVDILTDGSLDYPNQLLKELDLVVASPHAALSQDTAKCTARLLKAIDNPYVTIIGHMTGRLINRREGMHPDMKRLLQAAADRGIAMEINANYMRLDLRDTHARAAIDTGVKLSINTDAHGPADLDQLIYGVLTARRAGATNDDVINCMAEAALAKWLRSTRP